MSLLTAPSRPRERHAPAPAPQRRASSRPSPVRTARLGSTNALERSLVAVTLILVTTGVVAVSTAAAPQSIANGGTIWGFMAHDLVLVAAGLAAFAVTCRLPLAHWSRFATGFLVLSGGLLVVVRLSGNSVSGGQRWLGYGSVSFQPSELFALASCFYLAHVVARVERRSRHWIDLLKWSTPVLAGVVLIFLEPDMGTASVIVFMVFGMLILAGMPRRVMALATVVGGVITVVAAMAAPYRMRRLTAFLHPSVNNPASYQAFQAKIALGAGHVSGLGFGHSRAKWGLLPNPHTDFIFAIVGEEFGFIGTALVLALFAWLITLGLSTARRSPDRESQLLAGGITLWFGIEVLINVASVVGWWPVTGIPLPLISYGGTSLVINLVALGLLVNIARRVRADSPRTPRRSPTQPAVAQAHARRH